MSTLKTALGGYAGYRGREGQWSFLLHRAAGLGTGLFLTVHILDTAMAYFSPALYMQAIQVYRSTLFGVGEIGLLFLVFFHGVNGLRVATFDLFYERGWTIPFARRSAWSTLAVSLVLWVPTAGWMLYNLLKYNFGLFGG